MSKKEEEGMSNDEFVDIMKSIGLDAGDNRDVVDLNDNIEADIVFQTKSRPYLRLLWIVPLFALFMAIFLAVLFFSQNRVVEGDVVGAKYSVGKYSIIPTSYTVNNRDIKVGSRVYIKKKESPFLGPLLKDYEIVEVKNVKDLVISTSQGGTKDLKTIPIFDVLYVVGSGVVSDKENITIPEPTTTDPSTLEDELEIKGEVIESIKGKTNQEKELDSGETEDTTEGDGALPEVE